MTLTRQQQRKLDLLAMASSDNLTNPSQNVPNQTQPQVTLISENVPFPAFTGDGSESVHDFVRRVQDECTRRNVTSDDARLAVLKARISFEPKSRRKTR